ncbi:MAG: hypothetical protein ACRELA_16260 [Candidatus Rokuibacteriota bacterium]
MARRLYKASGLADRVRLSFTDCLGPCSEANVVLSYLRGQPRWFRRMNSPELFETLLGYAREALNGGSPDLPTELAIRSFSWAGGGVGPDPPVTDPVPGEGVA